MHNHTSPHASDRRSNGDEGLRRRHSASQEEEEGISGGQALSGVAPASMSPHPLDFQHRTVKRDPFADPAATDQEQVVHRGVRFDQHVEEPVELGHASSASQTKAASTPLTSRSLGSTQSPQPAGRLRGYSLRRVLFNKTITDRAEVDTANIELGQVRPVMSSVHEESGRKSFEARVSEIAQTDDFANTKSAVSIFPGLQGLSALPNYETYLRSQATNLPFVQSAKVAYKRARKFVLRISELPPSKDGRHIDVDATRKAPLLDERTGRAFIANGIRSSRYTVYSFLPRQLWAQFSKIANFYFLSVSILQMIPGLSTTGTYTTIVPLLFFVSLSMAKEGYDDFRRYRLDKEENNREATVLHAYKPLEKAPQAESQGPIHWATTKWKNIHVGDIVKLERDQPAPADLVVLHTTGENGVAYIETMALDGETNLKSKQTTTGLSEMCDSLEKLALARPQVVVEDPNLDLYNFEGRVTINGETAPLTNLEVIYRGSILRNTPELVGLVIYSGEECKIRMNASKNARVKAPSLQAVVNRIVVVICIFVILLAVFLTVGYELFTGTGDNTWYLRGESVPFATLFVSYIIMFNTMIPLSLYVSMEIIKVFQMLLLNDMDMYDEDSNTPLEARTSTINEELGQISYIFSDKTGTLTDNMMKFRKLSVAGTAWLHDDDIRAEAEKEAQHSHLIHKKRSKGKKPAKRGRMSEFEQSPRKSGMSAYASPERRSQSTPHEVGLASGWKSTARPNKAQPEMHTHELIEYIQRRPNTFFARKAHFFLLTIALCHTCLPETRKDGSIGFQAASPDELALVQAAQELGYLVIDKNSGVLSIKTLPQHRGEEAQLERYEILDVIEFSSKRKRMSVVVRFPDGRICVVSKGADSIIMQLLRLATLAKQKNLEIEARAQKRKSLEAHESIARRSEQADRRPSFPRPSLTIPRTSTTGIGRSSTSLSRTQPLRDQLDSWLTARETDIDAAGASESSLYYEPRPSGTFGRPSVATMDTVGSITDDEDHELVEEAMVVDEPAVIERCFQHINDFATEGLRTLLYGYRFLTSEEYAGWKKIYSDASTSLVDRQARIEAAGELIERELELAGATAIEDKLQKGVPEAIEKLRRANIKMWMLTGDKRETAINIGHSCRFIKDYSSLTILDHSSGQVEQAIAAAIVHINRGVVAHSVVVVDGQTLALIEADDYLKALFLDLAVLADSVICCRASPSQKAGLVKAIRHKVKKSITLAIGDGANDIAMIQEAHVGIGITGKEGLQAARTSDYSIAQFRFLTKLLLVHGRWNYIRTCKYVAATFWKEMLFYLVQAFYQRYCGYTGTSLYENWSLSVFNTLFTSLPVIFLGIFERDLAASTLLAVPELYAKGQRNGAFNFKIYLWWMLLGVTEACVIFFAMFGLFAVTQNEVYTDVYALGTMGYTAAVVVIAVKLQVIEMHNVSWANFIAVLLSVGGWFFWQVLLSVVYRDNKQYAVLGGFLHRFGTSSAWWFSLILALAAIFLLEIGARAFKSAWFPSDTDIFQELEKDLATRKRFEEASALELQQGWEWRGKTKKSSVEIEREVEEEGKREAEVEAMLRNRFEDDIEVGAAYGTGTGAALPRKSARIVESAQDESTEANSHLKGRKSEAWSRRMLSMSPRLPPGILKKSKSLGDIITTEVTNEESGRSENVKKAAHITEQEV